MYNNELYHFGVKGMRWGHRRYQNKDGTLTNAGRMRYDKNLGQKLNHRRSLEQKYMNQGMSQKQAQEKAAKRIKAEKFVAMAAGITVAACAAYCAHKNYAVDKTIDSNTDFQRIMLLNRGEQIQSGRMYVAYDKKDKTKYKGILANNFKVRKQLNASPKDIQNVNIKLKENLKVASPKTARDTFERLYKTNTYFRQAVDKSNREMRDSYKQMPKNLVKKQNKLFKQVTENRFKNIKSKGYDAFNIGMVNRSPDANKASEIFYNELRKKGIGAIEDINDKKYSGYKSKHPLIIFNGKYDYKGTVMSDAQIASNLKKAYTDIAKDKLIKSGSVFVGAYSSTKLLSSVKVKNGVNSYKASHPGTALTDKQIAKMLYG